VLAATLVAAIAATRLVVLRNVLRSGFKSRFIGRLPVIAPASLRRAAWETV
jgi:hypothetical protein